MEAADGKIWPDREGARELAGHSAGPCAPMSPETLQNEAGRDCWAASPMQTDRYGKEKMLIHVFNLERHSSSVVLSPTGALLERPWALFLQVGP